MEDPTTPQELAASDATVRAALVRAESLAALAAAGCLYPTLYLPSIENELAAIHISDDVGLRVFGVDSKGNVRPGPKGPMTANDVVAQWSLETPEFFNRTKRQ